MIARACSQFSGMACLVLTFCLLGGPHVSAQLPVTQLRTVFPPGGQAGSTVAIDVVEGDDLDELSGLIFNHPGIQQTDKPDPNTNPRRFTIQIAADVPAGYYSVRAQGRFGVSNPRMFHVETLPVRAMTEAELQKQSPAPLPLETVVYSRIDSAGDLDEFVVELQAGEKYGVCVESLAIDSQLVPVIEVFNPTGRRIEFARRVEERDPQLLIDAEQTGLYRITIKDFLFKGAVNYVYGLKVQKHLQPRSINPPALSAGEVQQVTVLKPAPSDPETPWTAGTAQLEILSSTNSRILPGFLSPRQSFSEQQAARIQGEDQSAALVAVPTTFYTPQAEHEPNNVAEEAQQLTAPCEIFGRFLEADDVDVYTVSAKQGETLWLEILAERDGQTLDPFIILHEITTDAAGKSTAKLLPIPDDLVTNLYPNIFDTLTDDIDFPWKAASDATLRITVRNRYRVSEDNQLDHYRLRISPPQPRFQAVALTLPNHVTAPWTADTPSGCVVRQGGTATFKVLVHRLQGFAEPVLIEATHTPPGVTIPAVVIPPTATSGLVVMHASQEAPQGFAEIVLTASAISAQNPQQKLEQYPSQAVQPAAVVWKGDAVTPAVSRLGHSLVVSVVPEKLPAAVSSTPHPAIQHVCQGQYVWQSLPVQRQPEAKEKVTLTTEGLTKDAKVVVVTTETSGDQTAGWVRFQFQADAKEGWQVCETRMSTSINYVRNPELLARQEASFKTLEQSVAERKTQLAQLATDLTASTNALEASKKTIATLTAQTAEFSKLQTAVQTQLDEQQKVLAALTEEAQKAEAMKMLEDLTQQKLMIDKKLQQAQAELATASMQQTTLSNRIETIKKDQAKLTPELAAAEKQRAAQKTALDKTRTEQKPKALKYEAYVDTQVFYVHKAPVTLTLKSPAKVTIKKGESVEATLELTRAEGVTGPIQFSLQLPPDSIGSGITCEPVTLAADQKVATLKLSAAPDAVVGEHELCVLRATTMHQNLSLSVDAPISISVP